MRRLPQLSGRSMALALNAVYLALGALVFAWAVRWARVHGTLLHMGE